MEQPPGYVAQEKTKVCHLKKVIMLYMNSSRVQGHSLRSSVLLFLILAFANVILITVSSFSTKGLAL